MAEPTEKTPQWYVVHTYSGYENKVKDNLEKTVENNGMQDLIFEITVPTEEVAEIRNGKRVTYQRKTFPGYVLVKIHDMAQNVDGTMQKGKILLPADKKPFVLLRW